LSVHSLARNTVRRTGCDETPSIPVSSEWLAEFGEG
jgi:hypothetical protein